MFFAVLTMFFIADKNGIAPVAILFSALHEFGHFLALLCVKTKAKEIKLSAFGIEIFLPESLSTEKKIAVLMAGFTANFIFAAVFFLMEKPVFACINFIIGTATAIPIASTDGGGILKIILEEAFLEKGERIFKKISIFLSFLLSAFIILLSVFTKNFFLLIAVAYIFIAAIK